MVKYNIIVATTTNDQPRWTHEREHGIREAKIRDVFLATVTDQYNHLLRGLHSGGKIVGTGSLDSLRVVIDLQGVDFHTKTEIYAERAGNGH